MPKKPNDLPLGIEGQNASKKVTKENDECVEGATVSQHIVPELGVMVVEITQALSTQDFNAVALTADTWIEAHGDLQGVVLHTRMFPGWENFGSFLRHVQFVREHHRKVKKVALSADSKLVSLVPQLAEHFVKAEIKTFAYDELDAAIKWAGQRNLTH